MHDDSYALYHFCNGFNNVPRLPVDVCKLIRFFSNCMILHVQIDQVNIRIALNIQWSSQPKCTQRGLKWSPDMALPRRIERRAEWYKYKNEAAEAALAACDSIQLAYGEDIDRLETGLAGGWTDQLQLETGLAGRTPLVSNTQDLTVKGICANHRN